MKQGLRVSLHGGCRDSLCCVCLGLMAHQLLNFTVRGLGRLPPPPPVFDLL